MKMKRQLLSTEAATSQGFWDGLQPISVSSPAASRHGRKALPGSSSPIKLEADCPKGGGGGGADVLARPGFPGTRRKRADPARSTIVARHKSLTKSEVITIIFSITGLNLALAARDREEETEWMLGRSAHNLGRESRPAPNFLFLSLATL